MNGHSMPASRRFSRGLSLIELMVSLAIGMIIVLATVSTYLGSSGASRMAEAQGRMNEDAQAALTILTQQLRMAGNNPKQPNRLANDPRNPVFSATDYILRGCDGKFSNITGATTTAVLTTCAGTSTLPDSIAIVYEADEFNTVKTASGAASDCLGQTLPTTTANVTTVAGGVTATTSVNFHVADNRFYVGTSTVVVSPSLYCKGNGGANAQPLVENIEDLQFTYGTAPASTSTGTVSGYLDANGVETDTAVDAGSPPTSLSGLAGGSPARWSRVVAARICVLVRSENAVVSDLSSAQYTKCDGTLETNPPDLRLRRAYSTTVVLRNRI
jgi:type IV pilus assembly protein PilW